MKIPTVLIAAAALAAACLPSFAEDSAAPEAGRGGAATLSAEQARQCRTPDRVVIDQADFDRTFTHAMAEANGIRMHYVIGGQGPVVVLLHGWPFTWYAWRNVMPSLAQHHTVIAVDLPGLGDSERPRLGRSAFTKRQLAEDVRALIRGLGFDRVDIIGHDWGGVLAYDYAKLHPDEVGRIGVLEITLPGYGLDRFIASGHWQFPFMQHADIAETLVRGHERVFLDTILRETSYDKSQPSRDELDEIERTYAAPGAMRASFEYYLALPLDAADDRRSVTDGKIAAPVLALGGEALTGEAVIDDMRLAARTVSGGVVPCAGHMLMQERPGFMIAALSAFLDRAATPDNP